MKFTPNILGFLAGLLLVASFACIGTAGQGGNIVALAAPPPVSAAATSTKAVPDVPFFSQFRDIHEAGWQKIGCGIASLAMILDFYRPGAVSADTLLRAGIASHAYIKNAGWSHKGLAMLAQSYGLEGSTYDLSPLGMTAAFAEFQKLLGAGPVIASVHYKFDPKNPIPHLVVITGIKNGEVYYNDPAAQSGQKHISIATFKNSWKKKFIVVRS